MRMTLGAAALALLLAGCGGDSGMTDESGARRACQKFVSDQLRSPDSADFVNQVVTSTGDLAWTVTGEVDAENGFGANVRQSWTCDVILDDGYYEGRATVSD